MSPRRSEEEREADAIRSQRDEALYCLRALVYDCASLRPKGHREKRDIWMARELARSFLNRVDHAAKVGAL